MNYVSTRDGRPRPERVEFEDALLRGLAPDGGLYVPNQWPSLSASEWRALRARPYVEVAARVIAPFLGNAFSRARLDRILAETYAGFDDPRVAPLKELASGLWLLELFHGPTLAFKDYALQLVGRLFDDVLTRRGGRVTIIGATSGDTGSAAIEAIRDRATADIFILYPEGRISAVQQRQMTTVPAANVHAIGIAGSFDDCQDLVKAMFADAPFRAAHNLSAVNSINWARIVAQTVYYAYAALALGAPDKPVSFTVPTGNFGNVYAAHVARMMGLPIGDLVIATNRNDILARFFNDGAMSLRPVEPSLSPSMDIQVSSNFERLFYDLKGRDGAAVADAMARFRKRRHHAGDAGRVRRGAQALYRLFRRRRRNDRRDRADLARPRRDARSAQRGGCRGRARTSGEAQRQGADGRSGDRASGEIPRRDRARHRRPAGVAAASRRFDGTAASGRYVSPTASRRSRTISASHARPLREVAA